MAQHTNCDQVCINKFYPQTRAEMSIFVNLLSLKATQYQSFEAKTPKPEMEQLRSPINQLLLLVENITKPHTSSHELKEYIVSKAIYNLNISEHNNGSNIVIYKPMKGIKSQAFSSVPEQVLMDKNISPIQKLYSAAKRENIQQENSFTKGPNTTLPLYSDSCQMRIKLYLFQSYESKVKLIPNIDRVPADDQFIIKRSELRSWIEELNAKQKQLLTKRMKQDKLKPNQSRVLGNSSPEQLLLVSHELSNNLSAVLRKLPHQNQYSKRDNDQQQSGILMTKQKFQEYSQQHYNNYLCTFSNDILVNEARYHLQMEFLLSTEKLREFSGYMRANSRYMHQPILDLDNFLRFDQDLQSRNLQRVNRVQKVGDSTKSNLVYTLDFSGTRESEGRFQSASRTERESMKRSIKNEIRPQKQQKQIGGSLMRLFQCCTSAQQVDQLEIKQANLAHSGNSSILKARSEASQNKSKMKVNNAHKQFYAGTCQNKNLFSMMDRRPSRGHSFTWFQQKY